MKVVIFGASGATGKHLVLQALEAGHEVTAFVRDPGKLGLLYPRLTIVQGNVGCFQSVCEAIRGQEAVCSALGADSMWRYDAVVVKGMLHILTAMEGLEVGRLIYLSTLAVKESRKGAGVFIRWVAPTLIRTEIRGHEAREKMIRQSKVQWTIVRAPVLTDRVRAKVAGCMLKQLSDTTKQTINLI